MKKHLLILIFTFSLINVICAQKAPMKYGKVDQSDLDMKIYPADSSAAAVILCNYGYFSSREFQFVHQKRIKILKEEGKSQGNFYVPANEKAVVKGQVVNMENGVPVVTKLGKESIFIERVSKNQYRARVACPNVKVGSVIDVEFYYTGLPSLWNFQETIPVRWSELVIEDNQYLSFRKNAVGFIPFYVSTDGRWVTKDVPAFKPEPFINNYQNYMSRFDIEISSIHIPGELYKDYATTWEAVAEALNKESNFGQELYTIQLYINGLAKQIKETTTNPEERLFKAYREIKRIKWNKTESIWISESGLSQSFNKKIGNASEVNLNLVLLLRKLDINANPLVLSTRSNGVLPQYSVSFDKLNYVAAYAVIGEKTYLLDATEENLPVGLLPERALNGRGMVVMKEGFNWLDLNPVKKEKTASFFKLKLSADGTMKGDWTKMCSDYAALDFRNHYKTFNSEDDYLKSIESKYIGLSVDKYTVSDFDSLQNPVKENFTIVWKNRATKTNNQLFINPILMDKWTENPFKLEQRIYPVDFTTAIEKSLIVYLELPEGYVVEQLPKNTKMALPENSASFQMQTAVMETGVQMIFKFNINKPVFYAAEYPDLKAYFDELVKKQSEMLILKKI